MPLGVAAVLFGAGAVVTLMSTYSFVEEICDWRMAPLLNGLVTQSPP